MSTSTRISRNLPRATAKHNADHSWARQAEDSGSATQASAAGGGLDRGEAGAAPRRFDAHFYRGRGGRTPTRSNTPSSSHQRVPPDLRMSSIVRRVIMSTPSDACSRSCAAHPASSP